MSQSPRDVTEPVDPDVGRRPPAGVPWPELGVIAVGGVAGALARRGFGVAWPTAPGSFPASTLVINAAGSALIGILLVLVTEARAPHRLIRPLLGTGVLGGFTTFSTYTGDTQTLLANGHAALALVNITGTVVLALGAVTLATRATRRLLTRRRR